MALIDRFPTTKPFSSAPFVRFTIALRAAQLSPAIPENRFVPSTYTIHTQERCNRWRLHFPDKLAPARNKDALPVTNCLIKIYVHILVTYMIIVNWNKFVFLIFYIVSLYLWYLIIQFLILTIKFFPCVYGALFRFISFTRVFWVLLLTLPANYGSNRSVWYKFFFSQHSFDSLLILICGKEDKYFFDILWR